MRTRAAARGGAEKRLVLRLRSPLGLALEDYRRAKGWGLNELARIARVHPAQLSRLEGAHQVSAHASTLRKLATALEVDVDHLLRLSELSRRYQWSTDTPDPILAEAAARSGLTCDVETAIERDPTIPPKRKKWLLECVALARR